ncbi:transmembrane 6 superfamily member 2 isoform X7 [Macaca fascicularis]
MSALILGLLFVAVYSLSHGEISYDPLYAALPTLSPSPTRVCPLPHLTQPPTHCSLCRLRLHLGCGPHHRSSGRRLCGGLHGFLHQGGRAIPAHSTRSLHLLLGWHRSLPPLPGHGRRHLQKVQEEQRKGLLQRPADLALVTYLILAGFFTLFRGLVVLDCPTDSCFVYIYQYEPYLRDPVAYPKVQMLMYMFYVLPFCGLAAYALTFPGCSWLPDWALVFAGAIGQAQFSHMGASMHLRTPFTYRVPEDTWGCFFVCNLLYALGPHLLAYRCLQWPAFFHQPPPSSPIALHKKQQ